MKANPNLLIAWLWILLGFASGMVLGLFFHRENWLGGYASFKRRMYRLAHISCFGLGAVNLLFCLTVRAFSLSGPGMHLASMAFITGAIAMRKGRFEVANGGTIFLDEIGDVSPATQVKLLRVLQEKEFERVGGHLPIKADVRILTATSRNLEEMIEQDKFRPDLYYRLNVFPIYAPPLRERKSDILLLADYFVEKYSKLNQKSIRRISTAAIDLLLSYHWPGNVRELENCIERSVLLSPGKSIEAHHLPPTLQKKDASEKSAAGGTLDTAVAALEYEMIVAELKGCDGNMAAAARKLGLTERQMGLRVKRLGIDFKRFRHSESAAA